MGTKRRGLNVHNSLRQYFLTKMCQFYTQFLFLRQFFGWSCGCAALGTFDCLNTNLNLNLTVFQCFTSLQPCFCTFFTILMFTYLNNYRYIFYIFLSVSNCLSIRRSPQYGIDSYWLFLIIIVIWVVIINHWVNHSKGLKQFIISAN